MKKVFLLLLSLSLIAGLNCRKKDEAKTPPAVKTEEKAPDTSAAILFPVIVDDKFGYIDRAGALVIDPDFEIASISGRAGPRSRTAGDGASSTARAGS